MIELLTAPTPNGWKISIMLEECGLPYEVKWINLGKGEQFAPEFLAVSPNNRIPAIIDHAPSDGGEPVSVFETGAILVYLAEKTGQFLPADLRGRKAVLEWLFWQVGGLGPMLGQHGHFRLYAPERIAYATERYWAEALRLYGVLDKQLARHEHVAGADYSIADMACFPWIQTWKAQGIPLEEFPALKAWYDRLKEHPGLRAGMAVGRDRINKRPQDDAEARRVLFGIKDKDGKQGE
jgi:GSH-dependent disulfide-bond oxidoreductase